MLPAAWYSSNLMRVNFSSWLIKQWLVCANLLTFSFVRMGTNRGSSVPAALIVSLQLRCSRFLAIIALSSVSSYCNSVSLSLDSSCSVSIAAAGSASIDVYSVILFQSIKSSLQHATFLVHLEVFWKSGGCFWCYLAVLSSVLISASSTPGTLHAMDSRTTNLTIAVTENPIVWGWI